MFSSDRSVGDMGFRLSVSLVSRGEIEIDYGIFFSSFRYDINLVIFIKNPPGFTLILLLQRLQRREPP